MLTEDRDRTATSFFVLGLLLILLAIGLSRVSAPAAILFAFFGIFSILAGTLVYVGFYEPRTEDLFLVQEFDTEGDGLYLIDEYLVPVSLEQHLAEYYATWEEYNMMASALWEDDRERIVRIRRLDELPVLSAGDLRKRISEVRSAIESNEEARAELEEGLE